MLFKGYAWRISLENADFKQSNFAIEFKKFTKRYKNTWVFFKSNNLGLLVTAKGKVLISFQSRLFPIKILDKTLTRESTPGPTTEPQVAKEPAAEPEVAKEPVKIKKKKKLNAKYLH